MIAFNMSARNRAQRKQYEARKAKHLPEILRLKDTLPNSKIAEQLKVHRDFVSRVLKEEAQNNEQGTPK